MKEKITLPKIELVEGINTIIINTIISPKSFQLKYVINESGEPDEEISTDEYFENKPNDEIKPITAITLRSSEIKAAGQTIYDEEHIVEYGTNELIIEEDYLAYTDELRLAYLEAAKALFGLTYKPLSINLLGSVYLDFNDIIKITNPQNEVYKTYALNNNHEYNGTLYNTITVPSLSEIEEKYKYETEDKSFRRKTAAEIDKANQRITALATNVSQYDNRISQMELTVDDIETLVRDEIDITRTAIGTDPLTLYNAMKGDLLELHIYGNNAVFSQLYPTNNLYPSDNLFPKGDSRIHVYTNNICPDSIDNWINGYTGGNNGIEAHGEPYNSSMLLSEFIKIDNSNIYISLENTNFKMWGITFYNNSKDFISKSLKRASEEAIICPDTTSYIRFEVVRNDFHYGDTGYDNNFPAIIPADILEAKPMITYATEKQEYSGYNNSIIELGVTDTLRWFLTEDDEVIKDSFDLVNNQASITRRIGVDNNGNLYVLANPIITNLGEMIIPVAEGENYFEIVNYDTECEVKWVIRNNYTNTFATTVELQSSITQLAKSINLQVSKKVGNDEIIARINMAVLGRDEAEVPEDIEKSIIEILANKISITSDYFSITNDGIATFVRGLIGNWNLLNGDLYSDHIESGNTYRSGMVSRNNTTMFLYSGLLANAQYIEEANFYVTNAGLCKAKWFQVNGESGYLHVNYDSGRTAMILRKEGIYWKLDDANNDNFASLSINANGTVLNFADSPSFTIYDEPHNQTLFAVHRYRPEAGYNQADIMLYPKSYYYAGGSTGYEIATKNDISDPSVKKNIQDVKEKALDKIKKIEFKQFDWDEEKIDKKGHINIGIIAPQVEKIDKNFVEKTIVQNNEGEKTEAKELYSLNILNLLTTSMKAIQELTEKVEEQQKEINELKEKLKGENNG